MQLRADSLDAHLRRRLARLYIVYGDEHLLVQEALDRIRAAARQAGYSERTLFTVDSGFDWRRLAAAYRSLSLFSARRLIELRMATAKVGKDGGAALQALAADASPTPDMPDMPDTMTLIQLPQLAFAAQKSSWFTALAAAGVAVRIDRVERAQLPAWLGACLAAQRQSVAASEQARALQFIAERVEGNLLAAHQEIQKLGLLYPAGELTFAQIHDAVLNVARYDVFKLNEAMLAGDVARLARMIEGLRGEGEAPALVLWVLTEALRLLWRLAREMADGRPLAVLLHEHRIWGAREQLIALALARLDIAALEAGLICAARLDRQLKGLAGLGADEARTAPAPADPWQGLFELALTVAAPAQVKARFACSAAFN